MADVNINAGKPQRFEDGTTVELDFNSGTGGGTDTYFIKNIIKGSFRRSGGGRALLALDMDRGVPLARVRQGDQQPIQFAFDVKVTDASLDANANELETRMKAVGADGYAPAFQVIISVPDAAGASTGRRATINNCVFVNRGNEQAGEESDTMTIEILSTQQDVDWVAY